MAAACPACMGEGHHDFTDSDALIGEHWTTGEILDAQARGMQYPLGVIECTECEGTGIVSDDRAKDLHAAAVAAVDQVIAKLRDEGAVIS